MITKNGKLVSELKKYDTKHVICLIGLIDGYIMDWDSQGVNVRNGIIQEPFQLFMAEPERWVNIYYSKAQDNVWASQFYESESEAKEHIISTSSYQTTIKINP